MLAGAGRGRGGCPPTNESSAEVTTSAARLLRRGQPLRELVPSSGERRKWLLRPLLSSGEGMLAEGRSVAGGRTSVKPPWSEVMIFLGVFLRQGTPLQEETVSSDERDAHRKTDCAREINSCEGMFAGRECVAGGGTPAKPRLSEVMIFLGIFLRQRRSSPEERVSAMKQAPYYEHILSFQTIIELVR